MINVLFIGNSYTYFNDMPDMVQRLCDENGIEASIVSLTRGGYSLSHFASVNNEYGQQVRELISQNRYDYVILQEQSVCPAEHQKLFLNNARKMVELLKPTGAKIVFYETWGRRDGEEVLKRNNWTHEEMQELLRVAYEKAAEENDAGLVRAGEAISHAYRGGVGDAIFDEDGSHPSMIASRIIAECFFMYLFRDRQ